MPLTYRSNMTDDELADFMAEIRRMDEAYGDFFAAADDCLCEDDQCEVFDPRRDGCIGWDGQP